MNTWEDCFELTSIRGFAKIITLKSWLKYLVKLGI
jgi:hypothetical protein